MIYIKHADGRTTEIEAEFSREATLAKIVEAIDGNDWGYVVDRLAEMNLGPAATSWEVAEIYTDSPSPGSLSGTMIGVIRLAPLIDVGSRFRAEREIRIYLPGDSMNDPSYVKNESIEMPKEVAR
jgi:hypothetical protein